MNPHLLAEDPEEFVQDDNAYLTRDDNWLYTWDDDEARQRGDGAPRTCGASSEDHCDRVPLGRAQWQYGPFGELLRETGDGSYLSRFRHSTKWQDTHNDLYYYGYRYYSPSMGRFLNRDPIEEQGGLNLYAFVGNDPVNVWD